MAGIHLPHDALASQGSPESNVSIRAVRHHLDPGSTMSAEPPISRREHAMSQANESVTWILDHDAELAVQAANNGPINLTGIAWFQTGSVSINTADLTDETDARAAIVRIAEAICRAHAPRYFTLLLHTRVPVPDQGEREAILVGLTGREGEISARLLGLGRDTNGDIVATEPLTPPEELQGPFFDIYPDQPPDNAIRAASRETIARLLGENGLDILDTVALATAPGSNTVQ